MGLDHRLLLLLPALVLGMSTARAEGPAKPPALPTLAVLPLKGEIVYPPPPPPKGKYYLKPPQGKQVVLGDKLDSRVVQAFFNARRFEVIERARMQQVLEEGKFEQSGLVEDARAAKLGKQLGAKFVVVGSYAGTITTRQETEKHFFTGTTHRTVFRGKLELDLRLVNTETGSIRNALVVKAAAEGAQGEEGKPVDQLLDELSKRLAVTLAKAFPVRGFIVKVDEAGAVIDLGGRNGVHAGDLFRVLERGEDLVHPVTGAVIKGELRTVGELVVEAPGEGSSMVRILASKNPLKPGMIVESRGPAPEKKPE